MAKVPASVPRKVAATRSSCVLAFHVGILPLPAEVGSCKLGNGLQENVGPDQLLKNNEGIHQ